MRAKRVLGIAPGAIVIFSCIPDHIALVALQVSAILVEAISYGIF